MQEDGLGGDGVVLPVAFAEDVDGLTEREWERRAGRKGLPGCLGSVVGFGGGDDVRSGDVEVGGRGDAGDVAGEVRGGRTVLSGAGEWQKEEAEQANKAVHGGSSVAGPVNLGPALSKRWSTSIWAFPLEPGPGRIRGQGWVGVERWRRRASRWMTRAMTPPRVVHQARRWAMTGPGIWLSDRRKTM